MALFKPWKGLSENLDSLPKKEGQFIVTTDDEAIYLDISSKRRIRIDQEFKIVNELPTEGIEPNTVYLLATESDDSYTQHIYRNNKWLLIGTGTQYVLDLSDNTLLLTDANTGEIISSIDLSSKYALIEDIPTKVSDLDNDIGYGTYTKPSDGIPKTDLEESVQSSLDKADTALQEHQDISGKEDKINKVTSLSNLSTDEQYPSAKAVYDKIVEKTTFSDFVGTDGITDGVHGLVPAPEAINVGEFLSAGGSWDSPLTMNNQEIIDIFYF